MILLKKEAYSTSYLHPRKEFQLTDVKAEMRFDPLTGHRVRVFEIDWQTKKIDFYALGEKNKHRCPFCEGVIKEKAARFTSELCKEGYFKKGSVTLIPNILPYAENAAVAVLTKEHVVPMGKMPQETIYNGLTLMTEYAKKVSQYDKKDYRYALLHWNYMPASGGSLIHPHMQVYVTDTPLNYHARVLEKALEFSNSYGLEFFKAYLEKEAEESIRVIAKRGRVVLIAPFASRGMLGEFLLIIEDSYNYRNITEEDFSNISSLIYDLTLFLDSRNIPAFNLALFSSPLDKKIMLNHIRIYPRVYRDVDVFATDVETPTLLYGESFSLVSPERNADMFRDFLKKREQW
ncbi:MAG: galactose-1-phosphate uridylyltransferase [bacterium]